MNSTIVIKRVFCERHRPLKLIRDIEEKKKQMMEDIVNFCNSVKKAIDALEKNRDRAKFRTAQSLMQSQTALSG